MACAPSQAIVESLVRTFLHDHTASSHFFLWTRNACQASVSTEERAAARWVATALDRYRYRGSKAADAGAMGSLVLVKEPSLLEILPRWNVSAAGAHCICETPPSPCGRSWNDSDTINVCTASSRSVVACETCGSSPPSSRSRSPSPRPRLGEDSEASADSFDSVRQAATHVFTTEYRSTDKPAHAAVRLSLSLSLSLSLTSPHLHLTLTQADRPCAPAAPA